MLTYSEARKISVEKKAQLEDSFSRWLFTIASTGAGLIFGFPNKAHPGLSMGIFFWFVFGIICLLFSLAFGKKCYEWYTEYLDAYPNDVVKAKSLYENYCEWDIRIWTWMNWGGFASVAIALILTMLLVAKTLGV
jgi:hypothetical protein